MKDLQGLQLRKKEGVMEGGNLILVSRQAPPAR
jgi:hypothetical protein